MNKVINEIVGNKIIATIKPNEDSSNIILRFCKNAIFPDGVERLIYKEYTIMEDDVTIDKIKNCLEEFKKFYCEVCVREYLIGE